MFVTSNRGKEAKCVSEIIDLLYQVSFYLGAFFLSLLLHPAFSASKTHPAL